MSIVKNFKVSAKLWLIVCPAIIALIALLVLYGLNTNKIAHDSKKALYDEVYVSTAAILNADRDFYQAAIAEKEFVLSDHLSSDSKKELIDSFNENAQQVQERVQTAIENVKENRALFSEFTHPTANITLEQLYSDFQSNYKVWQDSYDNNTGAGNLTDHQAAFDAAREDLNLMTELLEEYANVESAHIANNVAQSIILSVAVISMIIILVLLLSIVIVHYLQKSIKYITDINKRIAQGELSIQIDGKYMTKDEIGQLSVATGQILNQLNGYVDYIKEITEVLDAMAKGDMRVDLKYDYVGDFAPIKQALLDISSSLGSILTMINTSAEQVNSGAAQISAGAQTLSQGSTEQANSIEELLATIESVSQEAEKNTTNVDSAAIHMRETLSMVNESTQSMDAMLSSMNMISETSNQIKSIISIIDSIAFQTNILALNAAVEAARAGQSGKGFAVVADEVKNLARKSAEAAKQTSEMIETSLNAVADGINITHNNANALTNVFENIKLVNSLVEEIATSSKNQSTIISEVQIGISQISQVVLMNSATAEESAAASEELSAQAETLYEGIRKFKLNQ